jgi:preprotein translocase subunit SecE
LVLSRGLPDSDLFRHGVAASSLGLVFLDCFSFNPEKVLVWADEVVTLKFEKLFGHLRKDTTAMTIVVIIMVFISSLIITSFDFISA